MRNRWGWGSSADEITSGYHPESRSNVLKNYLGSACIIAAAMIYAAPALAQNNSASVSTTGSATIAAPITLTENSSLRFGSVVRPTANSNTVTLGTASCAPALTGTGNAALVSSSYGCATYSAGGESAQAFNIATDSTFDMTRSGGSETITVTLSKSASTGTIGQASADFKVGGSFGVSNTTVAGAYSGSFAVTATYQ